MPEQELNLSIGQALDLGVQYAMAGNHEGATGLFRGVLMHEPQNFEAIERLGTSLFELKRWHEALYWFWRGLKINRKNPMGLSNYGLCVSQLGHPDEALPWLERSVYNAKRADGMSPEALALIYNNLGNTYERLRRHDEALANLDIALRHNPRDGFSLYNRGIALCRLNRQRDAIASFDAALAIKPDDADARYNRGMARLVLGDLKNGFADYEARLLTTENAVPNLGMPAHLKWKVGESIKGKTILVHCEQGIGDDIQFFRFLAPLAALEPKQVLVIAHRNTQCLLDGAPVTVLEAGAELEGRFDRWVALMSLPLHLGVQSGIATDETNIPEPYDLPIDNERVAIWGKKTQLRPLLNVGVCWAGNWIHKNDAHRSIPLAKFAKIFDAPGCNFVSLQQMRPEDMEPFAQLKKRHDNLSALLFLDLRDTAAAILNLDLVVTVDTAIAHLAGSLGVPTIILIPAYSTDWRWQLIREDSPWYPSATLMRQPKIGDWDSVLNRLHSELSAIAVQHAAA